MLTWLTKGGRGISQLLAIADKGGRGVSQLLTIAEKGGREDPDPPKYG